jgi:hypothetical protein
MFSLLDLDNTENQTDHVVRPGGVA